MKFILLAILVIWLIGYFRFTGKRRYFKKLEIVAEQRHAKLHTRQSAIDLACAYMNTQRYVDAYDLYSKALDDNPLQSADIQGNMDFCKKPLPWSSGLKNHRMNYWHDFMLVRLGARRKNMMSEDAILALDNYNITGKIM